MERDSSPRDNQEPEDIQQAGLSCWGRLKLKMRLPWGLRRRIRGRAIKQSIENIFVYKRPSPRPAVGGFRYDPLSYAQNFDEGDDDEDYFHRHGFSSRYAAIPSK